MLFPPSPGHEMTIDLGDVFRAGPPGEVQADVSTAGTVLTTAGKLSKPILLAKEIDRPTQPSGRRIVCDAKDGWS